MLRLPSRWEFVWYQSGRVENIANTDTLTREEAEEDKARWDKEDDKVVRVTLETNNGDILKSYTF